MNFPEDYPVAEMLRRRLAASDRKVVRREDSIPSAVLLPLLLKGDEWYLLFTKRTEDLEHHKGQVSFPGGVMEGEESYEAAALREAFEEVRLSPQAVEILGLLHDVWTPSGYVITPVVGIVHSTAGMEANPSEVSRIFTVPLRHFMDDANMTTKKFTHNNAEHDVYFYSYDGETIWGATAFILRDFVQRLR